MDAGDELPAWNAAKMRLDKVFRDGFSLDDGFEALQAAVSLDFPKLRGEIYDSAAALIVTASKQPYPEYIPIVRNNFLKLTERARIDTLALLAKADFPEASRALMSLIKDYAMQGEIPVLVVNPLTVKPRDPEIFFPDLLNYASIPKLQFDIYLLALTYCQNKLISPEIMLAFADAFMLYYQQFKAQMLAIRSAHSENPHEQKGYFEVYRFVGLALDLMAYIPRPDVKSELRLMAGDADKALKCSALASLIVLDVSVDAGDLLDIAANAEVRQELYARLRVSDKLDLFPAQFKNQAALAESDMVNWLMFPTELGTAPDEIEMMKVVSIDTEAPDGIIDYYVFRFRMIEPHWGADKGWRAGVSGPYLQGGELGASVPEGTFSAFEPYDSMTPEAHVGDIEEILEEWWENHQNG